MEELEPSRAPSVHKGLIKGYRPSRGYYIKYTLIRKIEIRQWARGKRGIASKSLKCRVDCCFQWLV